VYHVPLALIAVRGEMFNDDSTAVSPWLGDVTWTLLRDVRLEIVALAVAKPV
jgi:hypothetical protein